MKTDTLPREPLPLSAAQAELMLGRQIKKHHVAIILLHWFNASVWLFELLSGAALITSPHFRVAPDWFITLATGVFGSRGNLLRFHIALGLAWICVFVAYGTFGFRTYLRGEVLAREVALDGDDWRWLRIRLLRLTGRSRDVLPPQGVYNAGQKLFALSVYGLLPVVMLSGLVMTFHWFGPLAVGWAVVAHFAAVAGVFAGLLVHVYMGAVFPEEKPAFFSMITGAVNELYAYNHHFKWWREVKMSEREWERSRETQATPGPATQTAAPVPAVGWFERAFRSPEYWPPYVAGAGLGLTLLTTFVIMGDGLGASGAFTRHIAALLAWLAPGYAAASPYWSTYLESGRSPLLDFLVFELIGVLIGGFFSGWLAHRLKITVDKGPAISRARRYALALAGGILTGVGARMARGCTSGLALSGGAVLSAGAFIFMLSVFAAGFAGAWLLRRQWL